jgi:BirA family biotin operon repressor/biotin-[acetyl-CoA-carboxylase] ligase
VGKNLVFMPECHSTNSHALQLCQQSPTQPEGTLVITDHQTAGRGQRGNSWVTETGKNFTLSILFKPTFLRVVEQFYLTIFVSLSIYDYLREKRCTPIRIKWPNDIYVGSKKICGILIENIVAGDRFSNVVVGIGLNVNQTEFSVDTATSMAKESGHQFDLRAELEVLLTFIEARYLKLRSNEFQSLMTEYLSLLYWQGETHTFKDGGGDFKGTITGLDEVGRLKIRRDKGEVSYDVKEISYVQ